MAEINYNTMFDQLSDLEKQQYEGVFGSGGFQSQYEQNPDSPLVTQNPNYEKFKEIADAQAQIPEESIMGMLNPFSEASAAEVTPKNYNSNYDIASNMYTPQQQELLFGNPNYFNNQKFYKGTSVPVATPFSDSVNEPMNIEDFLGTSVPQNVTIGQAPSVFDINTKGDPALNLGSVNVFGVDPFGVNEDLRDLGNPTGDPRVVSEEQGLVGGIPDRDRGMLEDTPGAPTGAYEMIGGTPVAIGDVLGMQQALEKSNLMDEPVNKQTFGIENLLGPMFTLAGFPTIGKSISAYNIGKSLQSGALGKKASSLSKGIRSLGTSFAGRMRGINPVTGKPNTQAQYEANREARRTQNRIDNMLDRKAKGKNYSEKNLKDLIGQQIADREDKSGKGKKSGFTNPGLNSYGPHKGSGGSPSGGKSIVCTAMYQTTGLQDWKKAMKIWYVYQKKHLTDTHQEGYHWLFKPFVKAMKKSKIVEALGAHVAKHRTQELKHILFNSKSDKLGKVYNLILEPICFIAGKIKSALGRG